MDFKQLLNKFNQYDTFNNTPRFINALIDYNLIKAPYPFGELERLYHNVPYNLTNAKNDLRHYYTNAVMLKKYPEQFVRDLGAFKEDADLLDNKSLYDTKGDFVNNEKGINLGKKYKNAPKSYLFDYIIQDIGLPLTHKNNKYYGYINNLEE